MRDYNLNKVDLSDFLAEGGIVSKPPIQLTPGTFVVGVCAGAEIQVFELDEKERKKHNRPGFKLALGLGFGGAVYWTGAMAAGTLCRYLDRKDIAEGLNTIFDTREAAEAAAAGFASSQARDGRGSLTEIQGKKLAIFNLGMREGKEYNEVRINELKPEPEAEAGARARLLAGGFADALAAPTAPTDDNGELDR